MKLKETIIKREVIILWIVSVVSLSIKNIVFQSFVWQLIPFATLYKHPFEFIIFYLPKLLPALFISCFLFVFKRAYWSIFIHVILDVWIISNLIYNRANGFFIGVDEILITNNMDGFWKAIITYFRTSFLIIPVLTIVYTLIVFYVQKKSSYEIRNYKFFISGLIICLLLAPHRLLNDKKTSSVYTPLSEMQDLSFLRVMNPLYGTMDYINLRRSENLPTARNFIVYSSYSIIAYLPMAIGDFIYQKIESKHTQLPSDIEMTPFVGKAFTNSHANKKMLLLLVESLESWSINKNGIDGKMVCPNLVRIVEEQNVLYCPHIKSQVRQGASGDGQMIVLTGLLPIQAGAACMLYGHNVYPSLVKLFSSSIIVNPCPRIWNQEVLNNSYGFDSICIPDEKSEENWNDKEILDKVFESIKHNDFVLGITVSTHTPFTEGESNKLGFSIEMPKSLNYYLNTIHFFDSCLGVLLNKINSDTSLQDLTVVITGDHTVFKDGLMKEFQPYAKKKQLSIPATEGFVPLIIKSPYLNERSTIFDTLYQMDIYPTILNLLGCQNYYWKGFGINILNDSLRHHRPILESEAYMLSDRIIKTDYFKTYKTKF